MPWRCQVSTRSRNASGLQVDVVRIPGPPTLRPAAGARRVSTRPSDRTRHARRGGPTPSPQRFLPGDGRVAARRGSCGILEYVLFPLRSQRAARRPSAGSRAGRQCVVNHLIAEEDFVVALASITAKRTDGTETRYAYSGLWRFPRRQDVGVARRRGLKTKGFAALSRNRTMGLPLEMAHVHPQRRFQPRRARLSRRPCSPATRVRAGSRWLHPPIPPAP